MSSNPSWINKGIMAHNFRTAGWIGFLYLLSLVFVIPLQLMMQYGNDDVYTYPTFESFFQLTGEIQVFIMFIIPILTSVVLFRYLQVKASADYMHSLPISRTKLFHQQFVFGMLLLIIPVVLTGIITELLYTVLPLEEYIKGSIFTWMAITIIVNLFVFASCTLVGIFTGITALQMVLTCILFFFPAGIVMLWMYNMEFFLFGYAGSYFLGTNVQKLSPFIRLMEISYTAISWWEFAIYGIIAVLFYILTVFLYQKRKVEAANQAIAFAYLRPIFKYGVTICFMLLGGIYFGETQNGIGWAIFGYFAGSIFGYLIAEMVLLKTWRVFHRLFGSIPFIIVMGVIGFLIHLDVFGYESKLPEQKDIRAVYFADNLHEYQESQRDYYEDQYANTIRDPEYFEIPGKPNMFEEEKNIESILRFHEAILEDRPDPVDTMYGEGYQNVAFVYELTNGEKIIRDYQVPLDTYEQYYKPIYGSTEYKRSHFGVLHVDPSEIRRVNISSYQADKQVMIQDPKKVEELVALIQEEVKAQPFNEAFSPIEPWGSMEITLEDNRIIQVEWRKSYEKIEEWLQQEELLDKARLRAEDIEKAVVAPFEQVADNNEDIYGDKVFNMTLDVWESLPSAYVMDDPNQIETALKTYSVWNQGEYAVAFFLKDQSTIIGTFDDKNTPDFIKEHY
ncbi:DUF6449 domain-containing protein [Radiobacillus kanasensis]|uniref:DUF6449 domain-containing protein n=1 Tax=Radiobacillus kanasensis TaxID=2844358 RepID=UPI001E2CBF70|nr:DUF6449 domain-containing protein [Radiobacillus kanasensis]UFT97762.1 DUF6449 domain-containing protein [Radiobacillus kanasensis]